MGRAAKESVEAGEVLGHADAVPQQQQRIECFRLKLQDIPETGVAHAALLHERHGIGADTERGHGEAGGLQPEGVNAGSCSDVENAPTAARERSVFDAGKRARRPEEVSGRKNRLEPVVPSDNDVAWRLAVSARQQCPAERLHGGGIHARPRNAHAGGGQLTAAASVADRG